MTSLTERFWSKVKITGLSDCWEWQAYKNKDGYGDFRLNDKRAYAHRFAYEELVKPIPEGLYILHSCNNPLCVNPFHLRAGTPQDNMNDREKAGNTARGEKQGNSKLTQPQVDKIRDSKGKITQRKLANQFGVSRWQINEIQAGRCWK